MSSQEIGWNNDITAPAKGTIRGEHGYRLEPERAFEEVDPDTYDLLVIHGVSPSGAPATVRDSEKAREIASAFFYKEQAGCIDLRGALDACCRWDTERPAPDLHRV